MKILQLISDRQWSGRTRYALDLARTFAADGYDTEVLTKGEEVTDGPFHEAGIKTGKLPLGGGLDFLTPVLLARKLRRDPSRCILIYTYTANDTSSAVRARELIGECGKEIRIIRVHAGGDGATTRLKRQASQEGDAVIFCSEAARLSYMEANPGVDERTLYTVHNSVIPGQGMESSRENHSDEITLLYLGRIAEGKGLETLVKALGKLKDLPLRLRIGGVGRGPYVSALKGEVWRADLTDRVEWLGHLADVYEEIRRADIGVVPTETSDTFGLTVLEFMSQGVPVIATDEGSVTEIITSGHDGLTVTQGDVGALAEAVRTLALSEETRRSLGEEGRMTFDRLFNYDRFMRETFRIVNALFNSESYL